MSSVLDYQVRAYLKAKKKKKEKQGSFPKLKLDLVVAEVRLLNSTDENGIVGAKVIWSELANDSVLLYSANSIPVSEEIAISVKNPKQIYVRGRITACEEVTAAARVLSANPMLYRIRVALQFNSEEERTKLVNHILGEDKPHPKAA